jgi:PST family polysaccharide transporter
MTDSRRSAEAYLRTDVIQRDVERRAARSGVVQLVGQVAQIGLMIISAAVLARLLTPSDFGLMGMAATLTMLATLIGDFGLPMAIVQRNELAARDVSDVFWYAQRLSAGLTLALLLLAPVLAWFFREPRVLSITAAMAVGGILSRAGAQHEGLLMRQMRFGALRTIEIAAMAVGTAVGIGLAWAGAGVWALVAQGLVMGASRTGMLWTACPWRPGRPTTAAGGGLRPLTAFAWQYTAARVLRYLGQHADRVVVGYASGAQWLGFYDTASRWSIHPVHLIQQPLLSVAVAGLSRLQHDAEAYRAATRKALLPVLSVILPALAFLALESEAVIAVLLGPKWDAAVPLFRVLCVGSIAGGLGRATQWLYLSRAETGQQMRWGFVSLPVMLVAVLVGGQWGPLGVALAFSIASWVLVGPEIGYCLRVSHVRWQDYAAGVTRPALATIAALLLLAAARPWLPDAASLVRLLLGVAIFTGGYVLAWLAPPGGPRRARDVLAMATSVMPAPPERVEADSTG